MDFRKVTPDTINYIPSSSWSSFYATVWGRYMFSSSILYYHSSSPCSLLLFSYCLIHTCHSRFIFEGEAKTSKIFSRDTIILPKWVSYEKYCRSYSWLVHRRLIAISQLCLSYYTTSMRKKERYYSYVLSRTSPYIIMMMTSDRRMEEERCADST
jgi:hypothetical protein